MGEAQHELLREGLIEYEAVLLHSDDYNRLRSRLAVESKAQINLLLTTP